MSAVGDAQPGAKRADACSNFRAARKRENGGHEAFEFKSGEFQNGAVPYVHGKTRDAGIGSGYFFRDQLSRPVRGKSDEVAVLKRKFGKFRRQDIRKFRVGPQSRNDGSGAERNRPERKSVPEGKR